MLPVGKGPDMTGLYPEIEPCDHGMLDVGDGNLVYWEICGDPNGKPACVLHGGPGSGCSTGVRRYFDPKAYRIVLFDQRGCGKSTPHASDLRTDLSVNTTEYLLADMEHLRQYLDIDKWLLFGGSWGSTLGLAYAERNPQRVTEIVPRRRHHHTEIRDQLALSWRCTTVPGAVGTLPHGRSTG